MIHPHTALKYISPEKGYGVVATQFIPKGTITWVQDKLDMVFTSEKIEKLGKEYHNIIDTYTFRNNKGEFVLCWDLGRFVNHSFNSNCLTTPYQFEIAIRDIQEGEELTDDYGYLNISKPFEAMKEGSDRTTVYPDDLLRHYKEWDDKIIKAMDNYTTVKQHLQEYLPVRIIKKMEKIMQGKEEMESILNCYYDAQPAN